MQAANADQCPSTAAGTSLAVKALLNASYVAAVYGTASNYADEVRRAGHCELIIAALFVSRRGACWAAGMHTHTKGLASRLEGTFVILAGSQRIREALEQGNELMDHTARCHKPSHWYCKSQIWWFTLVLHIGNANHRSGGLAPSGAAPCQRHQHFARKYWQEAWNKAACMQPP